MHLSSLMSRNAALFALVTVVSVAVALPALANPMKLSQQGRLVDDSGAPLQGAHQISFRLYDDSSEGSVLWSESRSLDLNNGFYSTVLGDQSTLDETLFGGSVWLELVVDGEVLSPRHQVVSVPTALRATVAEHLEGGVVDATEVWVGGQQVIDDTGAWVGSGGANSWDDLSDVPADLSDGDGDALGELSCFDGGVPKWNAASGQWLCNQDSDALGDMSCADGQVAKFSAVTGSWVCNGDTDTLGSMGCFDGGIPSWNASLNQWTCAADQDTDSDTLAGLNCANGGVPVWDALLAQWTCALSSDTVLSEGEVEAYVINGAIDLNAATTMAGQPLATTDQLTGIDFTTLSGVPADLADGDDILTETQVEDFITNAPLDLPAGTTVNGDIIGAGANLGSNVTIGAVLPGDNYTSIDTPGVIPDNNPSGFVSHRTINGGTTSINNFSVDVNITHTEMGDLRITLYTPSNSSVLLYDGELAGNANMVGNIARDFAISGGTIYALYGLDSNGTWRLEVVDNETGNTGTLNSWALNINETWSGDLFVGNSITADGDITTTGNIEVIQGSDLVFKNTAGAETLRIDGESGLITGAASGCPSSMVQHADFCIETSRRSDDQWYDAANSCASAGRRLCSVTEWLSSCRMINNQLSSMDGTYEWVDDFYSTTSVVIFRGNSCTSPSTSGWGSTRPFRCCRDL